MRENLSRSMTQLLRESSNEPDLAGRRRSKALNRRLMALHVSRGGAAHLLAAALFLDRLQDEIPQDEGVGRQMETIVFEFPAAQPAQGRMRTGVVASGDLEVLLESNTAHCTVVNVTTSVDGMGRVWTVVLERIFGDGSLPASRVEISDSGATPGVVRLRIEHGLNN